MKIIWRKWTFANMDIFTAFHLITLYLKNHLRKKYLYIVQLSINITTNYIKLNLQKLTGMEEYKLKTWGMYQLLINSSVCHVFVVSRKFLPLYTFFKSLESSFWVWHIVADPRANNCVGGRKQLFWLTLKVSLLGLSQKIFFIFLFQNYLSLDFQKLCRHKNVLKA